MCTHTHAHVTVQPSPATLKEGTGTVSGNLWLTPLKIPKNFLNNGTLRSVFGKEIKRIRKYYNYNYISS